MNLYIVWGVGPDGRARKLAVRAGSSAAATQLVATAGFRASSWYVGQVTDARNAVWLTANES